MNRQKRVLRRLRGHTNFKYLRENDTVPLKCLVVCICPQQKDGNLSRGVSCLSWLCSWCGCSCSPLSACRSPPAGRGTWPAGPTQYTWSNNGAPVECLSSRKLLCLFTCSIHDKAKHIHYTVQYTPSCNEKSKQFQNTLVIMLVCKGFATIYVLCFI